MKAIKKFKSFDQLKSDESNMTENSLSLKRHMEFEKLIKNIRTKNVELSHFTESEQIK